MKRSPLGRRRARLLGLLLIAAGAAALLLSEGCGTGQGEQPAGAPPQLKWNAGKWNKTLWG